MVKEELLKENYELKEKIQSQINLASAIEAKDKEIANLKNTVEELKATNLKFRTKIEEQVHLASSVEAKDKEIVELREKLQSDKDKMKETSEERLKAQAEQMARANDEMKKQYTDALERLRSENIRRVNELNKLIGAHGNLLKILQGTVDGAILSNEYLINEISKKEE